MGKELTPAQTRLLARLLDVDEADLPERLEQVNRERQESLDAAVEYGS